MSFIPVTLEACSVLRATHLSASCRCWSGPGRGSSSPDRTTPHTFAFPSSPGRLARRSSVSEARSAFWRSDRCRIFWSKVTRSPSASSCSPELGRGKRESCWGHQTFRCAEISGSLRNKTRFCVKVVPSWWYRFLVLIKVRSFNKYPYFFKTTHHCGFSAISNFDWNLLARFSSSMLFISN